MQTKTMYANIVLFLQLIVNTKYLMYSCRQIHALYLRLTLSFFSKYASNITQKLYITAACGWQHNPVIVTVTECVLYLKHPD